MFKAVLSSALSVKETFHNCVSTYIKNPKLKQQRDYKNCHQSVCSQLNIDDKVLIENEKFKDRNSGKYTYTWLGSYTVANIIKTGVCTLMNKKGEIIRKNCNISLLKRHFLSEISQEVADRKPATNANLRQKLDCAPVAEEKPNGNLESKIHFEKLQDEIVENILILATTTTRQTPETHRSVVQTYKRLSTIPE